MKTLLWMILGLLALGSIGLQLLGPEHPHPHSWDHIPGFYAALGFASCVLIVFVSRVLGRALLQKSEDYYDD